MQYAPPPKEGEEDEEQPNHPSIFMYDEENCITDSKTILYYLIERYGGDLLPKDEILLEKVNEFVDHWYS